MARFETLNWILTGLLVLFIGGSIFKEPLDEATDDSIMAEAENLQVIQWVQEGASGEVAIIPPGQLPPAGAGGADGGAANGANGRRTGAGGRRGGREGGTGWNGGSGFSAGRSRPIPRSLQKRFQSKQDVYDLAMTASSRFVELPDGGKALMITDIDKNSLLHKLVGLKENDVVMSVNGMMVEDRSKGWDMYESLRSQRSFEVELLRNGQRVTLKYHFQ